MTPAPAAPAEAEKITVDRTLYETVTSEEALDRWIAEARHQGFVAVDTETDCIDCIVARLVGISLATAPNKACYIPRRPRRRRPAVRSAEPAAARPGAGAS